MLSGVLNLKPGFSESSKSPRKTYVCWLLKLVTFFWFSLSYNLLIFLFIALIEGKMFQQRGRCGRISRHTASHIRQRIGGQLLQDIHWSSWILANSVSDFRVHISSQYPQNVFRGRNIPRNRAPD